MSKEKATLASLSAEDKALLLKELKEQEANKEKKLQENRKAYKSMVNETIPSLFLDLRQASELLSVVKTRVYESVDSLVKMKGEVYDREQDQSSHSFTTEDGITIIIGYRQTDGWDDTCEVGVQKVNDFLQSLGKDANSKKLVKTIMQLLAKDKTGTLKASRVLQLKRLADDIGDPGFKDAIQIIQDAYKPNRSRQFVTCRFKDAKGVTVELPLSITDADLKINGK